MDVDMDMDMDMDMATMAGTGRPRLERARRTHRAWGPEASCPAPQVHRHGCGTAYVSTQGLAATGAACAPADEDCGPGSGGELEKRPELTTARRQVGGANDCLEALAVAVDGHVEEVQRLPGSSPRDNEAAELESLRRSQRAKTVSYCHQRRQEQTQATIVGDLDRHVQRPAVGKWTPSHTSRAELARKFRGVGSHAVQVHLDRALLRQASE